MAMLHTVNKSPFERNALKSCIGLAVAGSSVLLIEDGVVAAMQNTSHASVITDAMSNIKFYVLGADLKARGLNEANLIDGISIVDYSGFVDLATKHDSVQSWL